MNNKKSQLMTFDLSASSMLFLVFIVLLVGSFILFRSYENKQEFDFELEYIFANLENNLKFDGRESVFHDYRVEKEALDKFASSGADLDRYILGNVGEAHGIGMAEEAYDSCLFFTDTDGSIMDMTKSGVKVLGELKSGSCGSKIIGDQNPCEGYERALSFFKPVLYKGADQYEDRIILMNIVVCEK
jgi:hypothetical protein